jgi:hypothetical protein
MIAAMRDLPPSAAICTCRSIRLDAVLAAMRRRHTREHYLALVAQLREAMPDIALSTDMIVGFPGETTADFEETLSLTAAVRYHSMFSFKYSERPNTLALKRCPKTSRTRRRPAGSSRSRRSRSASRGAVRGGRWAHIQRLGGLHEPAARVGTVGANQRQYGREFRGAAVLDRAPRAGAHHCGKSEQPARRGAGA